MFSFSAPLPGRTSIGEVDPEARRGAERAVFGHLGAVARELRRHDMVGSMGRVGAACDNAVMESFWSLLQANVLNQRRWATRQDLRLVIVVWSERKYRRQRAQEALGGVTPIEFEANITEPQAPRPKPNLPPPRSSRP